MILFQLTLWLYRSWRWAGGFRRLTGNPW